jgi:hypothetical protein
MAKKSTNKKDGARSKSSHGMFEMPSGLTHFAQSSAGELYVLMPEPNKIEGGTASKSHGVNKVNGAQLRGLFSNHKSGE